MSRRRFSDISMYFKGFPLICGVNMSGFPEISRVSKDRVSVEIRRCLWTSPEEEVIKSARHLNAFHNINGVSGVSVESRRSLQRFQRVF